MKENTRAEIGQNRLEKWSESAYLLRGYSGPQEPVAGLIYSLIHFYDAHRTIDKFPQRMF